MKFLSFILAIIAAFTLASCNPFRPHYTYRYRVTVEVETPQGVRSGSSVWQTTAWEGSGIPDKALRSREAGEAVAVDLPSGTLFALLRGADMDVDYVSGVVEGHLRKHPSPQIAMGKDWAENRRRIANTKPAFELYPDEFPLLVRFLDSDDPASIQKLDPADLASGFGQGMRLRTIVISVTNDAVSPNTIRRRLKWLSHDKNSDQRMRPKFSPDDWSLSATVRQGDFVRDR